MTKITQKAAVVNEVMTILGSNFDSTMPAKGQLTADQIKTIKSNVVDGIINDTIVFGKETTDAKEIGRYVSGMVSNHFRKAKELNGGSQYSPLSTGKGSRDSQVSELNKLLKTFVEGSDEHGQILSAIATRKTELAAEKAEASKAKKKQKEISSINADVLPEGLRGLADSLVSNT